MHHILPILVAVVGRPGTHDVPRHPYPPTSGQRIAEAFSPQRCGGCRRSRPVQSTALVSSRRTRFRRPPTADRGLTARLLTDVGPCLLAAVRNIPPTARSSSARGPGSLDVRQSLMSACVSMRLPCDFDTTYLRLVTALCSLRRIVHLPLVPAPPGSLLQSPRRRRSTLPIRKQALFSGSGVLTSHSGLISRSCASRPPSPGPLPGLCSGRPPPAVLSRKTALAVGTPWTGPPSANRLATLLAPPSRCLALSGSLVTASADGGEAGDLVRLDSTCAHPMVRVSLLGHLTPLLFVHSALHMVPQDVRASRRRCGEEEMGG